MDTVIRQFFSRVHARYTRSPHLADLSAFASRLTEQRYHYRYAQRLVLYVMRALDASALRPGCVWTSVADAQAFSQKHHGRLAGC